jgi:hypothetical protein
VAGRKRSGISLLEILFSIFIIAVGLMGIFALISLGHHQSLQGTLVERGKLVADYGYRDFRIRGYGPAEAIGDVYACPDDIRFSWRPTILDADGFVIGPDQFQAGQNYTLRIEVLFNYIEDAPYDDPRNTPIHIIEKPFRRDDALLWQ